MTTIFEIANHILANSTSGLSNRELQKILYFAQGFYLAEKGEPLFHEEFQAWKHGPVNSSIYHKYKGYGYYLIDKPSQAELSNIAPEIAAFLAAVAVFFGAFGQNNLIEFSHMDTPWAAKYIPDRNILLSKDEIKNYFRHFKDFNDYKNNANEKMRFKELIDSRIDYLATLPNIGDDWISGKAVAPNQKSCQSAQAFLGGLARHVFSNSAKPVLPKIVMGPIPIGGVSIELVAKNALYLHFYNDDRVEVETERDGNFGDNEISFSEFEENFSNYYEVISV